MKKSDIPIKAVLLTKIHWHNCHVNTVSIERHTECLNKFHRNRQIDSDTDHKVTVRFK